MKRTLWILAFSLLMFSFKETPKQEFYELRIYHVKTDAQEKSVDTFLKNAFLPALHKAGIGKIGVFKPVTPDTADRKIFVLIPYKSLSDITTTADAVNMDKKFQENGKDYLNAAHDSAPFVRLESTIIKAFSHNPVLQLPELKGPRQERVYELRSYEGPTEKIFKNKVHMFNEGGEVSLFKRLGFNAVFYGEVIAGSRMPNLMYMTTFENQASRDAHWKTFVDDPEWKKLSTMPEYQHNVSHIDIFFLRPTEFSDY